MQIRHPKIANFVENPKVVAFIIVLILINAVTLGLETSPSAVAKYGKLLQVIDLAILIVFTVELVLKLVAYRLSFFRSGWNLFDLVIVVIAWMPSSGPFAILRALRILRVLRLLSVVPQMRRVIAAIGHSIPGMMSVVGVLCLLFYVSAVLTTKLFGQHPSPELQDWFGTIGASAYTLFQIMTLESWSMGIVRPVMAHYPLAWMFFVPFIVITSFAVLNLFIGIIVDAMQMVQQDSRSIDEDVQPVNTEQQLSKHVQELESAVHSLNTKIEALHKQLDRSQHSGK